MKKTHFKIRKLTIIIILAFAGLASYAQNSTLVNAFYSRAQQEYTLKNYAQAISFLEMAEKELGTTINPKITYLQAKSHYQYDVNALKSKHLFLKFLNESNSTNHKTEEVSEIINDIENSNIVDSLGYFKDLSGRNGIKKTFFNEGNLHKVENYKNGLLDGVYQEYYENGKLFKEGVYNKGFLKGPLKTYYIHGTIKHITEYNESGKHGIQEKYNIDGTLAEILTYAIDNKNGSFKKFHEDGKTLKKEGSYKNNILAGIYKEYYNNGDISLSCIYKEGFKDGPEIKYYENGNQQWVKNYVNGKLRGIQKYFYDNKQLSKWEFYNDNGKQHGENKEYYKNGKLAITILYENGRVVDVIEQQNSKGRNINKSKVKQNPYAIGNIIKLYDNNKIRFYATYTDGVLDGEIKEYYENGQLKCEGFYNYGSRDGKFKYYYPSGVLKAIVNYKSNSELGFKDGEHIEYYETGEIAYKTTYQYNQEIQKISYYKNGTKSGEYNYLNDEWDYFPKM
ncbi:hypothetical protein APS56_00305 [Pseudalgibacter alginicilyticus]|uniref:Phophatidylinositol-4-phosphate 5-kinase n=1 Tax=Pseudalgibacter alginicilyticus TaxID=1736674 RepID=A0A0P0D1P5_9FLAO|nr:toxin-antitoxin system YwqK family antitoxin [Pseudalgibacter alginicilyticus]ALJ03682.1 hypothetical protein APS56_00305 [Pseudalgibacter alginicilyticus]